MKRFNDFNLHHYKRSSKFRYSAAGWGNAECNLALYWVSNLMVYTKLLFYYGYQCFKGFILLLLNEL